MKSTTLMMMAYLMSQESKCCSWKVGAVIAKDGKILGMGCNGTPSGHENCDEVAQENGWTANGEFVSQEARAKHSAWSSANEVHAEINAIMNAQCSLRGAAIYVTLAPCKDCAKAIAQSGITTLFYSQDYDRNSTEWADILRKSGIRIHRLDQAVLKNVRWENMKIEPKFVGE